METYSVFTNPPNIVYQEFISSSSSSSSSLLKFNDIIDFDSDGSSSSSLSSSSLSSMWKIELKEIIEDGDLSINKLQDMYNKVIIATAADGLTERGLIDAPYLIPSFLYL